MKYFLMLLTIIFSLLSVFANDSIDNGKYLFQDRINIIENDIKEIRRDELNYRIEKDLLKETYSSNFQTINIILAIALGLFSILGFIGIKDISNTKKEYESQLSFLNKMKTKLEMNINNIAQQQSKVLDEYNKIKEKSDAQSLKIQILEVQEKAERFIQQRNYSRALEYINVALSSDNDNLILLSQKSHCLFSLKEYSEATRTYELMLKIDNSNLSALSDLAELYLIQKNYEEYDKIIKINSQSFKEHVGEEILYYFQVFKEYQKGNWPLMIELIEKRISLIDAQKIDLKGWRFSEIKEYLSKNTDANTNIFNSYLQFLEKAIPPENLLKEINNFKST